MGHAHSPISRRSYLASDRAPPCGAGWLGAGWGTDERALIEILGRRTAAQRAEVRRAYAGLYRESLLDRLRSELSGDFRVNLPPTTFHDFFFRGSLDSRAI